MGFRGCVGQVFERKEEGSKSFSLSLTGIWIVWQHSGKNPYRYRRWSWRMNSFSFNWKQLQSHFCQISQTPLKNMVILQCCKTHVLKTWQKPLIHCIRCENIGEVARGRAVLSDHFHNQHCALRISFGLLIFGKKTQDDIFTVLFLSSVPVASFTLTIWPVGFSDYLDVWKYYSATYCRHLYMLFLFVF